MKKTSQALKSKLKANSETLEYYEGLNAIEELILKAFSFQKENANYSELKNKKETKVIQLDAVRSYISMRCNYLIFL